MNSKSIVVLAILLLAACMREGVQPEENGLKTFDCFTVSVEDSPMTKVHMEDGGAVKWDVGDCIGVYSDMQAPVPYYRGQDGKFYGEKVSGTTFYAYYPYIPEGYNPNNPAKLSVSVYGNELPMVARSEDNLLLFRQTGGVLHFSVTGSQSLVSAYLYGNRHEVIAGDCIVNLEEDIPQLSIVPTGNTFTFIHIPINHAKLSSDVGYDLYFILPPVYLSKGFSLELEFDDENDKVLKKTTKPVLVSRAVMNSYKSFDLDELIEDNSASISIERNALIALYNALDGDHWMDNTNWCSDKPLGEWYGVYAPDGLVRGLGMINGNNLQGAIPPEIGDLSHLEGLSFMDEPGLIGPIPSEIGRLHSLCQFSLHLTNNSGSLPPEIGGLEDLEEIRIYGTQISGKIPPELGNCSSLRVLDLCRNQFSGEIPEELGKLSHLYYLDVSGNNLSGRIPESLGRIPALDAVMLYDNYLSGPVPLSFMSLNTWEYNWPWQITQIGFPNAGFDRDSFIFRGPRFSVTTCEGELIDDSIYDENELTLLLELRSWNLDQLGPLRLNELYRNYKKKGLEIIGYANDMSDEELSQSKSLWNLPGKYFRYDRATAYANGLEPKDGDVYFLSNVAGPAVNVVDRKRNIVFDPYYTDFFDNPDTLYRFVERRLGAPDPTDEGWDNPGNDPYTSSDYSLDGTVRELQHASKGAGIDLVLVGDAFSDRLIKDGTYESKAEAAVEAFFSEEPYKSFRDYFNIYMVYAVSENELYGGRTALGTKLSSGTSVEGDNGKVIQYVGKAIPEDRMNQSTTIVLMNTTRFAGTCYWFYSKDGDWGSGLSIAYCTLTGNEEDFSGQILHEAGGHGFTKLADEYVSNMYAAPASYKSMIDDEHALGRYRNIDYNSDPSQILWSRFISDERYSESEAGVYEGALTYISGVYRSTMNSIMRFNTGGFNVPSREAIWYRIHKLAYGPEWEYNYEDFVTWDLAHRTPASISARSARTNFVERDFKPLAPPVVINKDWREVVKK